MPKLSKLEIAVLQRWGVTATDITGIGGDIATQLEDLSRHDALVYRFGFAIMAMHDLLEMRNFAKEQVALKIVLATDTWNDCEFYIAMSHFILAWQQGVHINGIRYSTSSLGELVCSSAPEEIIDILYACKEADEKSYRDSNRAKEIDNSFAGLSNLRRVAGDCENR